MDYLITGLRIQMNIFKNDHSLSDDQFSRLTFGADQQLTVIGHYQIGYIKQYIVSCSICISDPKLYQTGLFSTSIGALKQGKLPCGCSKTPKWNIEQWILICKRKSEKLGYEFFYNQDIDVYSGQKTKCRLFCKVHGSWSTTFASIMQNRSCKKCSDQLGSYKDDQTMIDSFRATGVYHADTAFYRSQRKTSQGARNYWWIECPLCKAKGEIATSDIRRGNKPCECVRNEKQAYINLIIDNEIPIAIKFGISKLYKNRVQKQNKKSVYDIVNVKVWEFSDKDSCRLAELECKQKLICGIIPAAEMSDGFSETTFLSNFNSICNIFESHGGVELI
ncbi:MAG: hypothetical protein EOO06_01185 [Chitinophagaceae bacterium]|nr:MAG: hypothetical protein EOO06_01185 [Chitinophagaceae bacterium]